MGNATFTSRDLDCLSRAVSAASRPFVVRAIEANRIFTGVTWVDGELWHGTWEGEESELRRIDPRTGGVHECIQMPTGLKMSGLESDGQDRFYCGGGNSGTVRAVRRPRRSSESQR